MGEPAPAPALSPPASGRRRLRNATAVAVVACAIAAVAGLTRPPARARLYAAIAEHGPESVGIRAVSWIHGLGDDGVPALIELAIRDADVTAELAAAAPRGIITIDEIPEDPVAEEAFRLLSPQLPDAVPHLAEALASSPSEWRRAEITTLIVTWILARGSDGPSPSVADDPAARITAEALARAIATDPSPGVRSAAVNALSLWTFENRVDAAWFSACWDALVIAAGPDQPSSIRDDASMLMTTVVHENTDAAAAAPEVAASADRVLRLLAEATPHSMLRRVLPERAAIFGDALRPALEAAAADPDAEVRRVAAELLDELEGH